MSSPPSFKCGSLDLVFLYRQLLLTAARLRGPQGIDVPTFIYYHSFSYLAARPNITASLLMLWGTSKEQRLEQRDSFIGQGLSDSSFRLAVNVKAVRQFLCRIREMATEGTAGVSLKVVAPTASTTDETRQLGRQHWGLQAGIWLFRTLAIGVRCVHGRVISSPLIATTFPARFLSRHPGPFAKPVGPRRHLSYDVKPRLWASLDRQFLVRWAYNFERRASPDSFRRAPVRRHILDPASKHQSMKFSIQQWRPRPEWR